MQITCYQANSNWAFVVFMYMPFHFKSVIMYFFFKLRYFIYHICTVKQKKVRQPGSSWTSFPQVKYTSGTDNSRSQDYVPNPTLDLLSQIFLTFIFLFLLGTRRRDLLCCY